MALDDQPPGDLLTPPDDLTPEEPSLEDRFPGAIRSAEHTKPGVMSTKGAWSPMQVRTTTAPKPGFGVAPAKDQSQAEYERVGNDYSRAMLKRYTSPALAAMAYNAGPGTLDSWLKKYGDPRTGAISEEEFTKRIPYDETRNYVGNVLKALQPVAPEVPPNDLITPPEDLVAPPGEQAPAQPPLSKGVLPNGMLPGHAPTLDPSKAGGNWSTHEISEDGIPKHYVLPTLPGDQPGNPETGELGTAAQRYIRERQLGFPKHYGAFDSDELGQAFMRGAKPPAATAPGDVDILYDVGGFGAQARKAAAVGAPLGTAPTEDPRLLMRERAKQMFGTVFAPDTPGMPTQLEAAIQGVTQSGRELAQTATGDTVPIEQTSAAAQPVDFRHGINFNDLAAKLSYQAGHSFPMITGGVVGGYTAGRLTPGPPPAKAAGALAGGVAGASLATVVQRLGPAYAEELQKTPNDVDGAYHRAWEKTGIDAAGSAAGWAAFGLKFFEGPIKNLIVQAITVQPGVAAGTQVAHNVAEGRPIGEGVEEAIGQAQANSPLLFAAHGIVRALSGGEGAAAEGREAREEPPPPSQPPPLGGAPGAGPSGRGGGGAPKREFGAGEIVTVKPLGDTLKPYDVTVLDTSRDGKYTTVQFDDGRKKKVPTSFLQGNAVTAQPREAAPTPPAEEPHVAMEQPPDDLVEAPREPGEDRISKEDLEAALAEAPAERGTSVAPVRAPQTGADLQPARDQVVAPKSQAQAEAGTYQKGHIANLHGMEIAMETPKGEERSGTAPDGTKWTNVNTLADYGYIKGTEGADGEPLDVYIGPNPKSETAYVVDQVDPQTGKFDEHKGILGADSLRQATAIYDSGFSDGSGPSRRAVIKAMPVAEFRDWAKSRGPQKPIAPQNVGHDVSRETIPAAAPSQSRPLDDRQRPIFKQGERVVINDEGPLKGRHGTIAEANALVMQTILGGKRETSYHYTIKTDEGHSTFAHDLGEETAPPAHVVPDPVVEGLPTPPHQVQAGIDYAKHAAIKHEAAAGRARKRESRDSWLRAAKAEREKASRLQAVLDAWNRKNPTATATAKSAEPVAAPAVSHATPSVKATYSENVAKDGVEVKFAGRPDDATLSRMKAAGFRWSSRQGLWYARRTPATLDLARQMAGTKPAPVPMPPPAPVPPSGAPAPAGRDLTLDRKAFREALNTVGEAQFGGKTYQVYKFRMDDGSMAYSLRVARPGTRNFLTDGLPSRNRGEMVQRAFEQAFPEPHLFKTPGVSPYAAPENLAVTSGAATAQEIAAIEAAAPMPTGPTTTRRVVPLAPGVKPEWTEIGKNARGQILYADQRGVRSYIADGIRVTEPVGMRPTRGGMELTVERKPNDPEWDYVTPTSEVEALRSQPVGKLAPGATSEWREIGKNRHGDILSEDQRGVRSYVTPSGIRHTEPVNMIPTEAGMKFSVDRVGNPDWNPISAPGKMYYVTMIREPGPRQKVAWLAGPFRTHEEALSHVDAARKKAEEVDPFSHFDAFGTASREGGSYPPGKLNEALGITMPPEMPALAPESGPSSLPIEASKPSILADRVAKALGANDKLITAADLQEMAEEVYGGTLASGTIPRDELYDALELGLNRFLRQYPSTDGKGPFSPAVDEGNALARVGYLDALKNRLPTQTVRAGEKETHQQFSTPPDYSYAASWVANLHSDDVVLEPSAGTGSFVAHALNAGVKAVYANELSERRADMLRALNPTAVSMENAEHLHAILPPGIKPTVVLMNPPFSAAATRMAGRKVLEVGANHVAEALKRLEPGGRLIAIVGHGMKPGAPTYRDFWAGVNAVYDVRANIGVSGAIYRKYGTTFPTRLLVIDKVAPSGRAPVVVEDVQDARGIIEALGRVQRERPVRVAGEQIAAQPGGAPLAPIGQGPAQPSTPLPHPTGVLGTGERRPAPVGGGAGSAARPGQPVAPGEKERGQGAGANLPLAPVQPGRPDAVRTGIELGTITPIGQGPLGGGSGGAGDGIVADGSGQRVEPGVTEAPITVSATEQSMAANVHDAPITDALYENYKPQRAVIEGAKPHPGALVQSAAMASVLPPKPAHALSIPSELIKSGALSDAQLEAVIYAGHAHSEMLPESGKLPERRRGFFIGDGTGVGKGREVAGIILDNWTHGIKKHIWVSEKRALINDAKRDWSGLSQNPKDLIDHGTVKASDAIPHKQGVLFTTYDTLKSGEKVKVAEEGKPPAQGKTRVQQIIDWVGTDFDGVIAFDESHNLGNSMDTRGNRGVKKAAGKALAGIELQNALPKARVVYVSATGATEVSNLAYADRLGLWGRGTAFPTRESFLAQVSQGGVAAMELVARDMKALGSYIARGLSYDGVEYDRLEHPLTTDQRVIYDKLAEAWQLVLRNFSAAMRTSGVTGQSRSGNDRTLNAAAKSAILSQFWGGHQRFFNQVITSLQMPTVLKSVEQDLRDGRQAVLQLVNTNEAAQERALAKISAEDEADALEDLDMSPKDQLLQMVSNGFPTQRFEQYLDDNGNERSRPVVDANGNPVHDPGLVAMRERLLDELGSIRVPDGPLEMLLNHFGTEKVAEVTGRKQRVVRAADPKTGQMHTVVQKRGSGANVAETNDFQSAKKPILVFSEAGGTGRSYHADINTDSAKARRSHYLVQPGWRADKAVQGFGRTHRTNQASAPLFHLVTTDLHGQRRFVSSIARRLGQLGALTKGERRTGNQGLFGLRDNLESDEARLALRGFFSDAIAGQIEGLGLQTLENEMGLKLIDPTTGRALDPPPMTQFLNRLLSLRVDTQNRVFEEFSQRLDDVLDRAAAAGTLDTGVETYRADKIVKKGDQVVYTDQHSGAETHHVHLETSVRNRPVSFDEVSARLRRSNKDRVAPFVRSLRSGKIFGIADATPYTDKDGKIIEQKRLIGPLDYQFLNADRLDDTRYWTPLKPSEAEGAWDAQLAKLPEFSVGDLHLITGAVLPIWDRLGGNPKIFRLQTDAGERMLGRVVPNDSIADTLTRLGAEQAKITATPVQVAERVLNGETATLANGWKIKRSMVAGEPRLELIGPNFSFMDQMRQDGVFTERINWDTRFFIPTGSHAAAVIEKVTAGRPVTQISKGGTAGPRSSSDEEPQYSRIRPTERDPFYSALNHGIEMVKQERASPAQWEGIIKNLPGVKQEDIDWSGVKEWLADQKGPVTKKDIVDFINTDPVKVQEEIIGAGAREKANETDRLQRARYQELDRKIAAGGTLTPDERTIFDWLDAHPEATDTAYLTREYDIWLKTNKLPAISADELRNDLYALRESGKRAGPETDAQIDWLNDFARQWTNAEVREAGWGEAGAYGEGRYEEYTLPGGTNYREILMQTRGRGIEPYTDRHFPVPVDIWARTTDRVSADGKKTLLVEEVQSGRHQAGRKRGYVKPLTDAESQRLAQLTIKPAGDLSDTERTEMLELSKRRISVPDAPFKNTWHELAMKRLLRMAAEGGYDRIAWTTGEQQAERYDLSKHIDALTYIKKNNDTYFVRVKHKGSRDTSILGENLKPSELPDAVGKEMADKIIADQGHLIANGVKEFTGLDLKIGGEGMKGFYDKMLPAFMNKYVKKWGAKVGSTKISLEEPRSGEPRAVVRTPSGWSIEYSGGEKYGLWSTQEDAERALGRGELENTAAVHAIDITLAMRDSVMAGQPMFSRDVPPPTETVGIGADLENMIELFGPKMYGANMPDVTMKELLQNSFDAVKAALKRGIIQPKEGQIDITVSEKDRTITLSDNGAGMSPQTVKDAFLTIAGTNKDNLAESERSGGFGVAKMAFIFGNNGLMLTTVRDGIKTTLDTNPKELLDGKATLKTEVTDAPPGTTVIVKVPEKTANGDPIHIGGYSSSFTVLSKPLIGDVAITFRTGPDAYQEILQNGRYIDLKKSPKVSTAHLPWGDIDIYMGAEREPYADHSVLSSGLYQFNTMVHQRPLSYERLPYRLIFDVRPKVEASDAMYPFNNQREDWSKKVEDDILQLNAALQLRFAAEEARGLGGTFARSQAMPLVRGALPPNAKTEFKNLGFEKHIPAAERYTIEPDIEIRNGKTIGSGGTKIDQSKGVEDNAKFSTKNFKFPDEVVPNKEPYFHSNLASDIIAEAERRFAIDPEKSRQFLAEIGTVVQDFRDALPSIPGYAEWGGDARPVGISLDKEYHGIHIKVPFSGFFVNPLSVREKTPGGIARSLVHTMFHEAVHTDVSGHSESFTTEFGKLEGAFEDQNPGVKFQLESRVADIINRYPDTFDGLRRVFDDTATKNLAKDAASAERQAQRSGGATRLLGRPLSVREGEQLAEVLRQGGAGRVREGEGGLDLQRPGSGLEPQYSRIKPPTTAAEGKKVVDDAIAGIGHNAPPPEIEKAAAEIAKGFEPYKARPSKFLSGVLGSIERQYIFPYTLAATDWRSAKFWNAVVARNDLAYRYVHAAAEGSKKYLALTPGQRKQLHAIEELNRLKNEVYEDDGLPIVAESDLGISKDQFLNLTAAQMAGRLMDAGIPLNDAKDIVKRIVDDHDQVALRRAMDQMNPRLAHSKFGDIIEADNQTRDAYFERRALFAQRWRDIMRGTAHKFGWAGEPDAAAMRAKAEQAEGQAEKNKLTKLAELIEAMAEQERTGYVPFARHGDYYINLKAKGDRDSLGGFPSTLEFRLVESRGPLSGTRVDETKVPKSAQDVIKEMREHYPEEHYDISTGYLQNNPEMLRQLDIPAIEKLLMVLQQKDSELYAPMVEQLQNQLYEELKAGFKRRARNTAGYDPDFTRATGEYFHHTAYHVADLMQGDAVRNAKEQYINSHPDKGTRQYWNDWETDQKRTPWGMPLQRFGFYYTMAGNLSTSMLIGMHGPEIATYTLSMGLGPKGIPVAGGQLAKAYGQVLTALRASGKEGFNFSLKDIPFLKADELKFLEGLETKGVLHSTAADELMGLRVKDFDDRSKAGQVWAQALKIAGSNVSAVDRMNRISVALTAYRMAKNPDTMKRWNKVLFRDQVYRDMLEREGLTPANMARFQMDQSIGVWGRTNQPQMQRAIPLGFQFQGFRMRLISSMWRKAYRQGAPGRLALSMQILALAAFAGVLGAVPFVGDLVEGFERLMKLFAKKDPMVEKHLFDLINDNYFGQHAAEAVVKGIPQAFLGAALSDRLQIGTFAGDLDLEYNPLAAIPALGIATNGLMTFMNRERHGQPYGAAAALMPAAVRNPYQAFVVYPKEGVRTQYQRSNEPSLVQPQELDWRDRLLKAAGVMPSPIERAYLNNEFQKRLNAAVRLEQQGRRAPAPYIPPERQVAPQFRQPSPYPR